MHESRDFVIVVMSRECKTPLRANVPLAQGDTVLLDVDSFGSTINSMAGASPRRALVVRQGQWRRIRTRGSFDPRDGAGLLVLGQYLYLIGGWTYETPYNGGKIVSEVWRSADAAKWEFLGNAPWPARHGAAWVVHRGRMFVIGGDGYADVWSSADGIQWTQHADDAPFGGRYTPMAVSLRDTLYIFGGQHWRGECGDVGKCEAVAFTDVWRSADGVAWKKIADAPWEPRALVHGGIVFRGRMWVVGGGLKASLPDRPYTETVREFSDVWSSADGITWTRHTPHFGIPRRTHFSVLASATGCYVSDGSVGRQANVTREIFFAEDCTNFRRIADRSPMQKRHASSLALFNGSLLILGGPPQGKPGTDVWQYFP